MATGMRVSAVVALVAAVGVVFALPARRRPDAVPALPQPTRGRPARTVRRPQRVLAASSPAQVR